MKSIASPVSPTKQLHCTQEKAPCASKRFCTSLPHLPDLKEFVLMNAAPEVNTCTATVRSLIFPNFLYAWVYVTTPTPAFTLPVPPCLLSSNIKSHNYKIRKENNSSLTDNCWSLAVARNTPPCWGRPSAFHFQLLSHIRISSHFTTSSQN